MSAPQNESVFVELLDTLASSPCDFVVLLKSFFDESFGDHDGLLCVAGYSFLSSQARRLDEEWRKMLVGSKLPYFRMSACNARKPPFDHLSEEDCIAVATKAIGLIGKYAQHGFAVTVNQKEFYKVVGKNGFVASPYELCAWLCLVSTNLYRERSFPESRSAFFFESGSRDWKSANRMMNNIFNSSLRSTYNYVSHAFVDKSIVRPTQAADLIAWQWFKDHKRNKLEQHAVEETWNH